MKHLLLSSIVALLWTGRVFGQGFIYDQQSAVDLVPASGFPITPNQPIGQSFTPSLESVGFVQFRLLDGRSPQTPEIAATIAVTLWAGSIGGTFLGSTEPVYLPGRFFGITNFLFAQPVAVVPRTTYYFQTLIVAGGDDSWLQLAGSYNYLGGTLFVHGQPDGNNNDAWFREGIVVPEPASCALMLFGLGGLLLLRRIRTTAGP